MISNIFVLSPRGDTILSKMYHGLPAGTGAHERSHTEAFFRKVKFWNDMTRSKSSSSSSSSNNYNNASSSSSNKNTTDGSGEDNEYERLDLEYDIGALSMDINSMSPHQEDHNTSSEGGESGTTTSTGEKSDGCKRLKKKDAPPVFRMPDGFSYLHIVRNGLIFGCSTCKNVSPCTVIELLSRIAKVFKDYCGTLSEESIRKNFILLYELLDEMIDYGYPQLTRTETLKPFVYNEPIVLNNVPSTASRINPKTASANAVQKPVISSVNASGKTMSNSKTDKNEIFVDILERLNVIFSNNGYVLNSTIDGCIQMKSYLAGNPELRLALNENLVIASSPTNNNQNNTYNSHGSVVLDDINFHDCVNLSEFEYSRVLSFYPPDGEFVLFNYRVTGDIRTPFRIFPSMEETSPTSLELTILVRAEMDSSHYGGNVSIDIPVPLSTIVANCHVFHPGAPVSGGGGASPSSAEYSNVEKKVTWSIKKFQGGSEQTLRIKLSFDKPCTTLIKREIGPINMNFEVPMFNVSQLNVRYLRIAENMPGYTPYRWVRYVTQSNSYVCRV